MAGQDKKSWVNAEQNFRLSNDFIFQKSVFES